MILLSVLVSYTISFLSLSPFLRLIHASCPLSLPFFRRWASGEPEEFLMSPPASTKKTKYEKPTKSSLPDILVKKVTHSKKKSKISWKMEEPKIVTKTRELFKTFRTQDDSLYL